MNENKKKNIILVVATVIVAILAGLGFYNVNKDNTSENIAGEVINELKDYITTYNMSSEELEELPSTEIPEQTEADEQNLEQEVESEAFEEQGEIAYNGASEYPSIELGNYTGLTYYSQIDSRWKNHVYTAIGDNSQTIGTSGCGPTSAAIVVTATKGTITPDEMGDLFVRYGYRSTNSGTYWSAFRWVADVFDIEYQETTNIDTAIELLRNDNYVVCSVANGLFTSGGHFIVLVGIEGDTITVYDPYLYAGKFDTSTRRGKATVDGNKVYVTVDNFKNYANFRGAFAYKHSGNVQENTNTVTTSNYTRYVNVNTRLNVRDGIWGSVVGKLYDGDRVTVYETSGNWSRIGTNRWVCSDYLVSYNNTRYTTGNYTVTASLLHVRSGAGTNYSIKNYRQLTSNARSQNRAKGNYYANGLLRGVNVTVSQVNGNWGKIPSGWICLDYCRKR